MKIVSQKEDQDTKERISQLEAKLKETEALLSDAETVIEHWRRARILQIGQGFHILTVPEKITDKDIEAFIKQWNLWKADKPLLSDTKILVIRGDVSMANEAEKKRLRDIINQEA